MKDDNATERIENKISELEAEVKPEDVLKTYKLDDLDLRAMLGLPSEVIRVQSLNPKKTFKTIEIPITLLGPAVDDDSHAVQERIFQKCFPDLWNIRASDMWKSNNQKLIRQEGIFRALFSRIRSIF